MTKTTTWQDERLEGNYVDFNIIASAYKKFFV